MSAKACTDTTPPSNRDADGDADADADASAGAGDDLKDDEENSDGEGASEAGAAVECAAADDDGSLSVWLTPPQRPTDMCRCGASRAPTTRHMVADIFTFGAHDTVAVFAPGALPPADKTVLAPFAEDAELFAAAEATAALLAMLVSLLVLVRLSAPVALTLDGAAAAAATEGPTASSARVVCIATK